MRRQLFTWYFLLSAALALAAGIDAAKPLPPSVSGAWSTKFTLPPGANGPVHAMATYKGHLLVGGAFTQIAGIPASGLAQWDGSRWLEFSGGAPKGDQCSVNALLVEGTNLFVGGYFESIGGTPASNIAKWTGDHWETLGEGVSSRNLQNVFPASVTSFFRQGSDLFVGGMFQYAGAVPSTSIARWDGADWHSVGGGVYVPWNETDGEIPRGGAVHSIAGDGTNIFVGGKFLRAGNGLNITNLACWNGSSWVAIGNTTQGKDAYTFDGERFDGWVYSVLWRENSLWVGGDFKRVNDLAITNLARWNGNQWDAPLIVGGQLSALTPSGSNLFLVGNFDRAGGVAATNLALVENNGITALNSPLHTEDYLSMVHTFRGQLFVGGTFSTINERSAGSIAKRVGEQWQSIASGQGNTLIGSGQKVVAERTNIYVIGNFTTVGTDQSSPLVKWDGASWSAVPLPDRFYPKEMAVAGTNLIVANSWWHLDPLGTNIALWDGAKWRALGSISPRAGFQDNNLVAVGTNIYVSGHDAVDSSVIQRWNGTSWDTIYDIGQFAYSPTLATDGTDLYTFFWGAYRWNGHGFENYPGPFSTMMFNAFCIRGTNDIWVAGNDYTAGKDRLLHWNGSDWSEPLGSISGGIFALHSMGDRLILGGYFLTIGGVKVNGLAQWDGSTLRSFDQGVYGTEWQGGIRDIAFREKQMILTGFFNQAGPNPSGSFAIWNFASDVHLRQATPTRLEISGGMGDRLGVETTVDFLKWNSVGEVTLTAPTQTLNLRSAAKPAQIFRAKILEP